ncbi:MAG: hypothetical protein C5B50_00575 [Verrucomicrobia bacterium]|nr:MAG: hypothetical protein C5B50_00575 [Verrucomicrobiota bacterium]
MVTWLHSFKSAILRVCLMGAALSAVLNNGGSSIAAEPETRVADTVAIEKTAAELEAAMTNQMNALTQEQPANASADKYHVNIPLASGVIVLSIIAFRLMASRFAGSLAQKFDPWAPKRSEDDPEAEERAFSEFAEKFANGPAAACACASDSNATHEIDTDIFGRIDATDRLAEPAPVPRIDPLQEFRRNTPKEIATMRSILSGLSSAADPVAKQKSLTELVGAVAVLKGQASKPPLRPFWQVSSALEGLLGQLAKKPAEITSSALRTIANALDLLNSLCQPDIKPELATEPAVRVLAVDDDAVCRHAISFALQKVLSPPDLASDGQAALALASELSYDVIFLDVEMPGMDGFELCSRLHATNANKATPVVFVTRHSDFDSRAKSSLSGGRELIGKPFLTFEIAVKALTMVMRRRLQANECEKMAIGGQGSPKPAIRSPKKAETANSAVPCA